RGSVDELPVLRAAVPPGGIKHVLVIDLENKGFNETFGPTSPATYLNTVLRSKGQVVEGYYGIAHFSLPNYIAQVSGQAPNAKTQTDCIGTPYSDIAPGVDDPNPATNPGQVDGQGCLYPEPGAGRHGAPTIADQLDAAYPPDPRTHKAAWRSYNEDMGNDPARDGGTPDPAGGTTCAHPVVGGTDNSVAATATDQFAMRHSPFLWFRSTVDAQAECDANVVPLGTLRANGKPARRGHLARDLELSRTTPRFGFIAPNLCNDAHDGDHGPCAGSDSEGRHDGGLISADRWLKHWMPLILHSPAYRSGSMLVVVTFDEADVNPADPGYASSCCYEQSGPNTASPGLVGQALNSLPGGGRTGAVLLNRRWIKPGTVNITGQYNHYSALRSYEDLLGLTRGGTDGKGHLGFAGAPGLVPFGPDVFNRNR
ncbi:MAG: alkaline phosphatase family protein, partial [Actinomycetota bacterium]|nr:alkaline phosphatase family protein [Actinomycetota bacterium]